MRCSWIALVSSVLSTTSVWVVTPSWMKMLNLLVLHLCLRVLGDEDRDHREPLHDAPDREQYEVERIVVAGGP